MTENVKKGSKPRDARSFHWHAGSDSFGILALFFVPLCISGSFSCFSTRVQPLQQLYLTRVIDVVQRDAVEQALDVDLSALGHVR